MSFTMTIGADSVVLPNPELGDTRTTEFGSLSRRTALGEFTSFYNDEWPEQEVRRFEFSVLNLTERDNFITFLKDHPGELISFDEDGETYEGIIITPDFEIITERDSCSYRVGFEILIQNILIPDNLITKEDGTPILTEAGEYWVKS